MAENSPDPRTGPPAPRSRAQQSTRDLLLSMLPLLLVLLALTGLVGMCSFSPGGPSVDPEVGARADPEGDLRRAVSTVDLAVREPDLTEEWRVNNVRVSQLGGRGTAATALRVGYLTPDGRYLRLSQSDAEEADLVAFETGVDPAGLGTVEAGGLTWVRYAGQRDEEAWTTELDGQRLLLTGSADEPEFRELAEATVAGDLVEPGAGTDTGGG
ncbi:DUF4245 domain-containing protein [Actinoalloteichus spitiensis]|uniref:DUF4245 domain-containing protein n=1 Tax=Actinoalloteichus spitiensis TaxID=252394 RepID=UPI0003822535|nr:DUF4245 domain-containing protein [Actinoalloteichus spitiensis]